jgi:hypothetical protein
MANGKKNVDGKQQRKNVTMMVINAERDKTSKSKIQRKVKHVYK